MSYQILLLEKCSFHLLCFTEVKERKHFDLKIFELRKRFQLFFFSFVVSFPLSLRLDKLFFDNLGCPESKEAEQLRTEVADNVSLFVYWEAYRCTCMTCKILIQKG